MGLMSSETWSINHGDISISTIPTAASSKEPPPPPKPKSSLKRQLQLQPNQPSPPVAAAAADGDKCPRCKSGNTKFCYYNNYNKTQPRHFCKACKRHWTKGGTLRNVPVGGGKKKNNHKRIKTTSSSSSINTADKPLGLSFTDKKKSHNHYPSSNTLIKPPQLYDDLSSSQHHIFNSSSNQPNSYLFSPLLSTDHDHHHVPPSQINNLLEFGGTSLLFPYQTLMTTNSTTTDSPSQLEESLSIFNSSYNNNTQQLMNSFQTSYGYTSDQSTSLDLDKTLNYSGTVTNSINDHTSTDAAVISNLPHEQHQAWDEIDVSWDIDDYEINQL